MPKFNKLSNLFYLILVLSFLFSCKSEDSPKDYVARVYDKYLFKSDLVNVVPYGIEPEDSSVIVNDYIQLWIRNMLTLKKAELNLTDDLLWKME